MGIIEQLQNVFSKNVWKPDHLTKIDSDPRWRAIDVIEEKKGITIEWNWDETDFSKLGSNPIVIEFTSTKDDAIKFKMGLKIVEKIVHEKDYEVITGNKLIVLIERVQS